MDYLRRFYNLLKETGQNPPSWEEWRKHATENAELWPIRKKVGDKMEFVGGVLFKGTTVHITIAPEWHGKWITKELVRAYRTWTPAQDVYTFTQNSNKQALGLIRHLGDWKEIDPPEWIPSWIKKSHTVFVKEAVCPQQ